MNQFAINIEDENGKHVGELMTASLSDILSLINKGMTVIDKESGEVYTPDQVCSMMGVSDGLVAV